MLSLFDVIYGELDYKALNREQVEDYLRYLEEIITPDMTIPEQVKYLKYKVALNRRLVQLDKKHSTGS